MSFASPVAFIFSHSALREGWDSPNVCQIVTLNQTVSEVKKRQEVGRGMRLVVDQTGRRVADPAANVLTVVANESYEQFVESLQTEMEEAFGKDGAAPRPTNVRSKTVATRKPLAELSPEFANLWDRIRPKTRYRVTVDAAKLVADVVAALDRVRIEPPRVVSQSADVTVETGRDKLDVMVGGKRVLVRLPGEGPVPNIVGMIEDLLAHVRPPIKLTRRTLAVVVTGVKDRAAALNNPQEFASQAARLVREFAVRHLVDGIRYEKDGTWYEMTDVRRRDRLRRATCAARKDRKPTAGSATSARRSESTIASSQARTNCRDRYATSRASVGAPDAPDGAMRRMRRMTQRGCEVRRCMMPAAATTYGL